MNKIDLTGKNAIVTGAGTGIGRGIALELARHGANVMVCDRNMDGANETVRMIAEIGTRGYAFKMDVTSEESAEEMAKRCVEQFGSIDLLYNNAGTISMSTIEELTLGRKSLL